MAGDCPEPRILCDTGILSDRDLTFLVDSNRTEDIVEDFDFHVVLLDFLLGSRIVLPECGSVESVSYYLVVPIRNRKAGFGVLFISALKIVPRA
jgi:hypothetical protein